MNEENQQDLPLIGEYFSLEHEENLKFEKLNTEKKTKDITKDYDKKVHKGKHRSTKYNKKDHNDQYEEVYIKKDGIKNGYTADEERVRIVNENYERNGKKIF